MATKLYVGGLSWGTTQDALQDHFSQAGNVVSATVITDKMSGRSKGFGFVEMGSEDEAKAAIEMFNGKEFDGRTLTVNEARPMEPRQGGGGGYNRGGQGGGRGGFGGGRGGRGGGHGGGHHGGGRGDRNDNW
jgi:RNA recognition motif-containing protein